MKPADDQHLQGVIARNAGAVISLPSAGMLRHHKTRFLGPQDGGFWVESPRGEKGLVEQLIAGSQPVGMSIKANPNKIIFTSLIRQFQEGMQINRHMTVDALLMRWPEQVVSIQRRDDYRVMVPGDAELQMRAWRIAEQHILRDRPLPSTELAATLRDLSVGGMALLWDRKEDPPLAEDQRLRITLDYEGGQILLEGRVRHMRPLASGLWRLGVQFRAMENDLTGRQALASLTHLVGLLQRDEIRRHRRTRAE